MLELNLPKANIKIAKRNGKAMIFDDLRKKFVSLTPEEWVRQHFVNYLITEKEYPASLIANEVGIKLNNTLKRCDTVVYDKYLEPALIVEYKAPTVEINENVFNQIVRYNMVLKVKHLIVSNGLKHYCCSIDYEKQTYSFINSIPDYSSIIGSDL